MWKSRLRRSDCWEVRGDGTGIEEARKVLGVDLSRRIRERARRLRVSAASVFHVAWGQVLSRVSGRADVVFGTVLFGRMEGGAGVERVMGLFINTLPVRIEIGERECGVECTGGSWAVGVSCCVMSMRHCRWRSVAVG